MITEGNQYEEKLIKMNPILNKRNRYKDILPCKFFIFIREMNSIGLKYLDKMKIYLMKVIIILTRVL